MEISLDLLPSGPAHHLQLHCSVLSLSTSCLAMVNFLAGLFVGLCVEPVPLSLHPPNSHSFRPHSNRQFSQNFGLHFSRTTGISPTLNAITFFVNRHVRSILPQSLRLWDNRNQFLFIIIHICMYVYVCLYSKYICTHTQVWCTK